MTATELATYRGAGATDADLVAAVRDGDDAAFERLYRRYQRRISSFIRRLTRDETRAEDITQEAFVSALRRLRATDSEIIFKPWIYEIARNAAIDHWRRSTRAEEVSISEEEQLRPADRSRLVGAGAPEALLFDKERIDHLRRAMDELSQTHHKILVMRELEGLSYREIGERLELSRPAVESTLFRARRRLEREYEEIEAGRRCQAILQAIARISEGMEAETDMRRIARHARGCSACRRHAREMGVEPFRGRRIAARVAAVLPLPAFLRRRLPTSSSAPPADPGFFTPLVVPSANFGSAVVERAAALVTAAALAGAGGAALHHQESIQTISPAGGHQRGATAGTQRVRAPVAEQRARRQRGGPALRLKKSRVVPRHLPTGRARPMSLRQRSKLRHSPFMPPRGGVDAPAGGGQLPIPPIEVAPAHPLNTPPKPQPDASQLQAPDVSQTVQHPASTAADTSGDAVRALSGDGGDKTR